VGLTDGRYAARAEGTKGLEDGFAIMRSCASIGAVFTSRRQIEVD
jgi:hypothetical protein